MPASKNPFSYPQLLSNILSRLSPPSTMTEFELQLPYKQARSMRAQFYAYLNALEHAATKAMQQNAMGDHDAFLTQARNGRQIATRILSLDNTHLPAYQPELQVKLIFIQKSAMSEYQDLARQFEQQCQQHDTQHPRPFPTAYPTLAPAPGDTTLAQNFGLTPEELAELEREADKLAQSDPHLEAMKKLGYI